MSAANRRMPGRDDSGRRRTPVRSTRDRHRGGYGEAAANATLAAGEPHRGRDARMVRVTRARGAHAVRMIER